LKKMNLESFSIMPATRRMKRWVDEANPAYGHSNLTSFVVVPFPAMAGRQIQARCFS